MTEDLLEKAGVEGCLHGVFEDFMRFNSSFMISEQAELPRFRGSGIPHCPIHVAADYTRADRRVDQRSFMLDYMAEHGKLVHALMQKWLGIIGVMFGKWQCNTCKSVTPKLGSGLVGVCGPVYCCGQPCEYVEYDIDVPSVGYTGHCDGLLMIRKKLLPIEMKVRKADVISRVQSSGAYSIDNITQATSYRRCLPAQLKIPAAQFHDFVGLLYFDRADIRKRALVAFPYNQEIFDAEVRSRRRTEKIIETRRFNYLRGFCKNSQDRPYCPYHSACFAPNAAVQLERLLPGFNEPLPERIRACPPNPQN